MSYIALVAPYAEIVLLPTKAFWKLAVGFLTDVWPPSTTSPVMPTLRLLISDRRVDAHGSLIANRKDDGSVSSYKVNVKSLMNPITLFIRRDHRVLKSSTVERDV
jgi:hypothetical protein